MKGRGSGVPNLVKAAEEVFTGEEAYRESWSKKIVVLMPYHVILLCFVKLCYILLDFIIFNLV